jgi:hydroxymethylpyrimidine/phosphomethylpyrimidine kinase
MQSKLTSAAPNLLRNRDKARSLRSRIDRRTTSVLTIGGSDSGGGAGIQADLKTFAAFGIHGLSAITAVTAQNTHSVIAIHRVPASTVEQQLHAVFADFRIAAIKIGMLGSAATIRAVAHVLRERCAVPIVLDPVLVSSSGTRLLPASALAVLRNELIPLISLLTPNVPEAEALLGRRLAQRADLLDMTRDLLRLGAESILLKGGHCDGNPICDYFVDAKATHVFQHPRKPIVVHGTGCVLSAAIAAGLALGHKRLDAVRAAERHLQQALRGTYLAGNSDVRVLPLRLLYK